jgi:preprotein translocase SecE subunit
MGLPVLSLLGAIYVLATLAVVLFAFPQFWQNSVASQLGRLGLVDAVARFVAQFAVLIGLVWFGRKLLGESAPKGVRGGIFLALIALILTFFVWRLVASLIEGGGGMAAGGVAAALTAFGAVRLITSKTGEGWMTALEEQGWFSTASYKRSLGQRARRLTILGLLLLGGSGVYSLMFGGTLPHEVSLSLPLEELKSIVILPDAQFTVPLILLGLTLWVAWRAVNVPEFAEFLIATEAEMNKVSWTPKKRLAQDTVVVLTTTLIMALFLLLVDLFWGWLLSREIVGVLPGKGTASDKGGKIERARW